MTDLSSHLLLAEQEMPKPWEKEVPEPSAPLLYLIAAFTAYIISSSFAVAALIYDVLGEHHQAAKVCASVFFGPLGATTYLIELIFAKTFEWVSWYGRAPPQLLRHHGAFLLVMLGFCWMWIVDRPKISTLFVEHMPFRIWLITAGLTNLNECFIVFQNFMFWCGINPITPGKVFYQRCLALSVMSQALILGVPSGAYLFIVVLVPEAHQHPSLPVVCFGIGVASQFAGQLLVQLPDSLKLLKKLLRK